MRRSVERILTTHAGSLPRPPDLLEMIQRRDAGEAIDQTVFATRVEQAVHDVVRDQIDAGIDVVSDGEMGKPSFATYVLDRIDGFGGENTDRRVFADMESFPGWASTIRTGASTWARRCCIGPLSWRGAEAVAIDAGTLKQAAGANEAFLPSATPGIVADVMANRHYPSESAYLYALADALKYEYQAIADAGLILQLDAPDMALGRHVEFRHRSLEQFRRSLALRVEVVNHALDGVPEEQVRLHICWGNYEGPHVHDVPLRDIADVILRVNAAAYSFEAANPRHAHEWDVWKDLKLPEQKLLIPGVIDSLTNFVEHPELVAQRIEQFAGLVGRERVIAGTDCGFGTTAARTRVHPEIVWAKLAALAEGARIASARLWGLQSGEAAEEAARRAREGSLAGTSGAASVAEEAARRAREGSPAGTSGAASAAEEAARRARPGSPAGP